MENNYKSAGVDVEAGYRSVSLIKEFVKKTDRKEVLSDLGGFGGMFSIAAAKDMKDPVLVSGTDGVGTKLKIAFLADKHDTIGIDCVAMCVNDIVCSGAEPLFFLDYIACGKNFPEKIAQIVKGVCDGCEMSGCSLLGGETAEMPGFYPENEYDLAGFAVGIVDREKMIDGKSIKENDILIGIASSGLHSNGFSLVRKVLNPNLHNSDVYIDEINGTFAQNLLIPTKIYVKTILNLKNKVDIKGVANITGGGFYENIPRMFPDGLKGVIEKGSFHTHDIFKYIQKTGDISEKVMYNTFNMGIGMVICVEKDQVDKTLASLKETGETAFVIGEVKKGQGIDIC